MVVSSSVALDWLSGASAHVQVVVRYSKRRWPVAGEKKATARSKSKLAGSCQQQKSAIARAQSVAATQ